MASIPIHQNRTAMQPIPTKGIISAGSERSKDMPTSQSCQELLLSLMLLAGLAGCGQTSSDNAPNLESSERKWASPFQTGSITRQQPIDSGHPVGEPRASCLRK